MPTIRRRFAATSFAGCFRSAWQADEEQTAVLMDVVASSTDNEQEANADIGILLKRRMAFQMLSRKVFSTAMPGKPFLMAFEDVHWIDPTSGEFLENMVRNAPEYACAVIATTRPEGGFAERLSAHSQIIRLQRLSDTQSLELAKAAGQSTGMDDETLQAIVEKSDGVPLFVEEYALMLRENAGARDRAGRPHELRSIPLTLSGLVQNKLDRLDPHAQMVARLGATVGRVFELQLVRTLSGLARPAFEKALDTLEAADIAHRDQTRGASRTATFKHALVKDAVYTALSTLDRRRLHASVADTMLAESEDRRVNRGGSGRTSAGGWPSGRFRQVAAQSGDDRCRRWQRRRGAGSCHAWSRGDRTHAARRRPRQAGASAARDRRANCSW